MSHELPGGGRSARHRKKKPIPQTPAQVPGQVLESDARDKTIVYGRGSWLRNRWLALRLGWRNRRTRGSIIAGFLIVLFLIVITAFALPLPEPVIPYATVIYDINDQVAGRLFTQSRVEIPFDQMAKDLVNAAVASEDARFYRHHGVDPIGIARALVRNITSGHIVEGGSTLTQQLAKNLYTTGQRTVFRKLYDAFLAMKLEQRYSKEDILELYLNTSYLGHGAYGVEVASQQYFGKDAKDLTLAESAMLIGILPLPEVFSPYKSIATATDKRNIVLTKMAQQGYISDAQAERAKKEKITLISRKPLAGEAQYFAAYIVDQIASRHPEIADIYTGGYQIHTTLDIKMQRAANSAFDKGFTGSETDANGVPQPEGALVAMDPKTGEIRAMVGGRDFNKTQLNRAYQSQRQPGSSFKPFVYSAVIDKGFTAASTQTCEPVSYPSGGPTPYEPADYGTNPFHYAPMTTRRAIAISDNISSVKWTAQIGPRVVAAYATKMGVTSTLNPTLPIALGASEVSPLDLCTGYCTLANGGNAVKPISLLRLTDKFGNVIEENRPSSTRVLSEQTAFIVTNMMTGVMKSPGTGAFLAPTINRPAAGKTGTTNSQRDAWFAGFTPELVCAVWVGFDDPSRTLPAGGGRTAGPIWAAFIAGALSGKPATPFSEPAGMEHAQICQVTGLIANNTCPAQDDAFVAGSVPVDTCPWAHDPNAPYANPTTPLTPSGGGIWPPSWWPPGLFGPGSGNGQQTTPGTTEEPAVPGMLTQLWEWLTRTKR